MSLPLRSQTLINSFILINLYTDLDGNIAKHCPLVFNNLKSKIHTWTEIICENL